MRIAFMHRSLVGGGTEADLRRMAVALAARGHDVHVFCAKPAPAPAGVTVRRVPVVRAGRVARLLSFAVGAPRAVAREQWDVVMGFGRTLRQDVVRVGGGTHASYLRRMEASGARGRARGPYHRAILWLERRQFATMRRVLTVSRLAGDEVASDYGVAPGRITVLYNGIDLERFHPRNRPTMGPALRAALEIERDVPLCVAIGTGFVRKGFDVLLGEWACNPPGGATLLVVGDDERLRRWQREAVGAPNVEIVGPRRDVDAVLAAADVVCAPSRQEAFGNVVLEACAAGVPVVTSRRSGVAELLDGPLRSLVVDDPEDWPTLAAAIERALGPEGAELGAAGRRRAETLGWPAHDDALESFLREVADGG
jgi:UDP-glucose:(heptosyl)LPS alpha-1,3-glucosyltransferase